MFLIYNSRFVLTKHSISSGKHPVLKEYRISSFEKKKKKENNNSLVFLPNGVSTKIALKSSVGFEAMLTASICSKLPNGWHLGTSSAMGR